MQCNPGLSFEECEFSMIKKSAEEVLQRKLDKLSVSPIEKQMIHIVETYLKSIPHLCYGNTAVNDLLPKHAQFYDYSKVIPNYIVYTPTAVECAKEMADIFAKEGFIDIYARRSNNKYGQYRVNVNRMCVVEFTWVKKEIFDIYEKDKIVHDGICYVSPNILRQSLYLDLSKHDYTLTSNEELIRWNAIYSKLALLNEYHPIDPVVCNTVSPTNQQQDNLYYTVRDILIELEVVFMGGYADLVYIQYMGKQKDRYTHALPDFDVLAESPKEVCLEIKDMLVKHKFKNIKINKHAAIELLVGEHYEIIVDHVPIVMVYEPLTCHSYNTISIRNKTIRIATIETLMSYYLSFLLIGRSYHDTQKIMCMASLMMDIQKKYVSNYGLVKQYSNKCYGPDISEEESMRDRRAKAFDRLKYKKGTIDYDIWFLSYNPITDKSSK